MADNLKIIENRKYMWDGRTYDEKGAKDAGEAYGKDGFDVKIFQDGGQHLVYTRRVVKEVKVEGAPA
jgi:hypothetical protein